MTYILVLLSLLLFVTLCKGFSHSKPSSISTSLSYHRRCTISTNLMMSTSSSSLSPSSSSSSSLLSIRNFVTNNSKRILLFTTPIIIMLMFGSLPSHAAKTIQSINDNIDITTSTTKTIAKKTTLTKIIALIKVIFDGANVKGNFRTWQAGDTRTEFAAVLNSISSIAILSFLAFIAYIKHKQREFSMNSAMKKEIKRVREYKEKMYFEAVEEILGKLADPKTKGSTKASLQKQLKEIDPDGLIQNYLTNGGDYPDIGYILEQKPKKKKTTGSSSSSSKAPKKKSEDKPKPKPKIVSYDDDDEDDDNDVKDSRKSQKNVDDDKPKSPKPKSSSDDDDDDDDDDSISTPKNNDILSAVMKELDNSLSDVIDGPVRSKLIKYLFNRIESISDSKKREATLSKIAEKLGDEDYWIAYAEKNIK